MVGKEHPTINEAICKYFRSLPCYCCVDIEIQSALPWDSSLISRWALIKRRLKAQYWALLWIVGFLDKDGLPSRSMNGFQTLFKRVTETLFLPWLSSTD